jgi:hypothetical protein
MHNQSDNRKELSIDGRVPPETLDTILIKGTFDVMCCGENYEHHVDKMMSGTTSPVPPIQNQTSCILSLASLIDRSLVATP